MSEKVYSVRQVTAYIKGLFQNDLMMSDIQIRGELSNVKYHPSGHIYFTMKDSGSQISGIMFSGNRVRGLRCKLREGMQVVVRGYVSVYEAGGSYQIYAKEIKDDGAGALYQKFLELRERLQDEGLFSDMYKQPIPAYARTVGVVTASSGAALQDILQISKRRNPCVQLILCPALVQGADAPLSLVEAIQKMDALHPDVMIVGRGGGSMEDLWAFNDERVARAVFACSTPVISAVGHEVDWTIIDYVADHRAPTPSAAAELAVFEEKALRDLLSEKSRRAEFLMTKKVQFLRSENEKKLLALRTLHPKNQLLLHENRLEKQKERLSRQMEHLISEYTQKTDDRSARLERLIDDIYRNRCERLSVLSERLNGRSPLTRLRGGFGYLSRDGKALLSAHELKSGDRLQVTLHDGTFQAAVTDVVADAEG